MQTSSHRGQRRTRKLAPKLRGMKAPYVVVKPSLPEVLDAMRSLYAEQLRPFGRILRKRLGEIISNGSVDGPDVDATHLRWVCDSSVQIRVEEESGGDWTALFDGQSGFFVDAYSPQDPYPSQLWLQAGLFFQGLSSSECLPGGRYACAQELRTRRLHCFAGRSLGELCHIVQLAISQKRLLGYLNGTLVPYCRSQSIVKEHAASQHTACSRMPLEQSLPLASFEATRLCLQQLLTESSTVGQMPLSNVKRLFRSHFGLELSETALGSSKLCDLLTSSALADVCTVRLDWNGYTVVQVAPAATVPSAAPCKTEESCHRISESSRVQVKGLSDGAVTALDEPRRSAFCEDEPLELEDEAEVPEPRFVKLGLPRRRAICEDESLEFEELASCNDHATMYDESAVVQNTFLHHPVVPPSPLPGRPRSYSLPDCLATAGIGPLLGRVSIRGGC